MILLDTKRLLFAATNRSPFLECEARLPHRLPEA
jgi:hypothetical protein